MQSVPRWSLCRSGIPSRQPSSSLETLLGVVSGKLVGKPLMVYVAQEDRPAFRMQLVRLKAHGYGKMGRADLCASHGLYGLIAIEITRHIPVMAAHWKQGRAGGCALLHSVRAAG